MKNTHARSDANGRRFRAVSSEGRNDLWKLAAVKRHGGAVKRWNTGKCILAGARYDREPTPKTEKLVSLGFFLCKTSESHRGGCTARRAELKTTAGYRGRLAILGLAGPGTEHGTTRRREERSQMDGVLDCIKQCVSTF